MRVAETAPAELLRDGDRDVTWVDPRGKFGVSASEPKRLIDDPLPPGIEATIRRGVAASLPQDPTRPWQPMTEAVQDGTLLEGRAADGTEFHMIWRRTSRYDAFSSRWVRTAFWSSHLSREPLKVEPVQWRLPEGFAMPGAIVA